MLPHHRNSLSSPGVFFSSIDSIIVQLSRDYIFVLSGVIMLPPGNRWGPRWATPSQRIEGTTCFSNDKVFNICLGCWSMPSCLIPTSFLWDFPFLSANFVKGSLFDRHGVLLWWLRDSESILDFGSGFWTATPSDILVGGFQENSFFPHTEFLFAVREETAPFFVQLIAPFEAAILTFFFSFLI